jgi:hypothetical protein
MTSAPVVLVLLSLGVTAVPAVHGQSTDSSRVTAPLDGPGRPLSDSLLDHLAGRWRVTRQRGRQTTMTRADADWVLNHQFVRLHYHDDSASAASYEAIVFIGYDNASERYVAHWLDIFGGRWSETLGYGTRVPNGIRFVFEYPDGPFVNAFTFDGSAGNWSTRMRQKNARGEWVTFGEEHFARDTSRR